MSLLLSLLFWAILFGLPLMVIVSGIMFVSATYRRRKAERQLAGLHLPPALPKKS